MLKRLWFELNKPRKMWDITNLIGYAIIATMVVSLNNLAYNTGAFVATKEIQKDAIEHHAGMWDVFGWISTDGGWYWREEWEQKLGRYPWEITKEVQEKLDRQRALEEQEKLNK